MGIEWQTRIKAMGAPVLKKVDPKQCGEKSRVRGGVEQTDRSRGNSFTVKTSSHGQ